MTENNRSSVFRKKTLDRISSPEQLTDYLRVTNPGIWAILAAVILLLAGLLAWATVGTLETSAVVKVIVSDHTAQVITLGSQTLDEGMPLRVSGIETRLASAKTDEYGRAAATAELALPDGVYDGIVVVEQTRPLDFLLTSR